MCAAVIITYMPSTAYVFADESSDEPAVVQEEPAPAPDKDSDTPSKSKGVDTGDSNNLTGLLVIFGVALAGFLVAFFRRKRDEK